MKKTTTFYRFLLLALVGIGFSVDILAKEENIASVSLDASFSFTVTGSSVSFSANNFSAGNTYTWDFGDGNFGVGENSTHSYVLGSVYRACLTVSNASEDCRECESIGFKETFTHFSQKLHSIEYQFTHSNGLATSDGYLESRSFNNTLLGPIQDNRYITKRDLYGNEKWTIGFLNLPIINDLAKTNQGYLIMGHNYSKPIILEINEQGDVLWSKEISGLPVDTYNAIIEGAIDSAGELIIMIRTYDGITSLMKLDNAGNIQWSKSLNVAIQTLTLDASDHIILGGNYNGDMLVYKVDQNGTSLWAKTFGGINSEVIRHISSTSTGSYLVSGSSSSYGTGSNPFLLKVNIIGLLEWASYYQNSSSNTFLKVQEHSNGRYYAFGDPSPSFLVELLGTGAVSQAKETENLHLNDLDITPNGDLVLVGENYFNYHHFFSVIDVNDFNSNCVLLNTSFTQASVSPTETNVLASLPTSSSSLTTTTFTLTKENDDLSSIDICADVCEGNSDFEFIGYNVDAITNDLVEVNLGSPICLGSSTGISGTNTYSHVDIKNKTEYAESYTWKVNGVPYATSSDLVDFLNQINGGTNPAGVYEITLETNTGNCIDISTDTLAVLDTPDASFTYSNTNAAYEFEPLELNSFQNYSWDFGDGNTSTDMLASHSFAISGSYVVCLDVENICDIGNFCETITVSIIASCTADFTYDALDKCALNPILFTNNSTDASVYEWYIDDVLESTDTDYLHTFPSAGSYAVKLIASDGGACQDTITQQIVIYQGAGELALADTFMSCDLNTTLDAGLLDMASYVWRYEGALKGFTKTINADQSGTYTLTVFDSCTTTMQDTMEVFLNDDGQLCVFPGDFNFDFIANEDDFNALALAMSSTGIPRPNASLNWEGQPCPNWLDFQPNGNNFKHVDGDGNGTIDFADLDALITNFDSTHNGVTANFLRSNRGDFALVPVLKEVRNGMEDTLIIDLHLVGNRDTSVDVASYGLSFNLEYPRGEAFATFDDSWLGENGLDVISFYHDTPGNHIDMGVSRIDLQNVVGRGKIGQVNIIDENLPTAQGWRVRSDDILMNDNIGDLINVRWAKMDVFMNEEPPTSFAATSPLVFTVTSIAQACQEPAKAFVDVLSGTPPYTYAWDNGETTAELTNLTAGLHFVSVTDGLGNRYQGSTEVELGGIILAIAKEDETNGQANGTATVIPSGGVGSYTYAWSNGSTTSTISGLSEGVYIVTVTDSDNCWNVSSVNIEGAGLSLDIKLFLEGPYVDGQARMSTMLNTNNLIPTLSPYAGIACFPADESTSPTIFQAYEVVDWVTVELYHPTEGTTVACKSGLLMADGHVTDVDGISVLRFPVAPDQYNVRVGHRNHLSIETLNTVQLASSNNLVDFTQIALKGNSNNYKTYTDGTQALIGGDATSDGSINAADRSSTWNERNTSGYLDADVNLDGSVNAADRSITWNSRNKTAF